MGANYLELSLLQLNTATVYYLLTSVRQLHWWPVAPGPRQVCHWALGSLEGLLSQDLPEKNKVPRSKLSSEELPVASQLMSLASGQWGPANGHVRLRVGWKQSWKVLLGERRIVWPQEGSVIAWDFATNEKQTKDPGIREKQKQEGSWGLPVDTPVPLPCSWLSLGLLPYSRNAPNIKEAFPKVSSAGVPTGNRWQAKWVLWRQVPIKGPFKRQEQ